MSAPKHQPRHQGGGWYECAVCELSLGGPSERFPDGPCPGKAFKRSLTVEASSPRVAQAREDLGRIKARLGITVLALALSQAACTQTQYCKASTTTRYGEWHPAVSGGYQDSVETSVYADCATLVAPQPSGSPAP